jgi:aryl-alcohol dehydrogenase-like predicted oxidoreductase
VRVTGERLDKADTFFQRHGAWIITIGPPRDRDEALRVLRAAVVAGVDHIDTAQYYGVGTVNEFIHEALFPYPDGLAIGRFRQMAAWQRARRMERVPVSWSGSRRR